MMLTIEEINTALEAVKEKYNLKKAVLFGSYAHGTATEDSDIDVLIEFEDGQPDSSKRIEIMEALGEMLGANADVIVGPLKNNSLFVLDENGVPIYMTGEERDKRLVPALLHDIACIKEMLTGKTKEDFVNDDILHNAVSMQIVKFAERGKGFSGKFWAGEFNFPKQKIITMRNTVAHDYWINDDGKSVDVNYEDVWDFIHEILIPLEEKLNNSNG